MKNLVAAAILLAGLADGLVRAQEPSDAKLGAELASLQTAIKAKGAKWTAGETSISRLTAQESSLRLGLVFGPIKAPPLPALTEAAEAVLPKSLDWRDRHAVSGIRDQGQCGSCWAFAMTQALESHVMLERKSSDDVRLSEQVLLSCSGVGNCEEGGTLTADFLRTTGLPPESDYPYSAKDGDCRSARPGWRARTYKIQSWNKVEPDLSAIKAALATYGPLPTSFQVMDDFRFYKSGIYSYTQGKTLGGHAVLLVGYDDDGQYFIVKNSWGPDWGEGGFFRIAYSEMNDGVHFGESTIAYTSGKLGEAPVAFDEGPKSTAERKLATPAKAETKAKEDEDAKAEAELSKAPLPASAARGKVSQDADPEFSELDKKAAEPDASSK